MTLSIESPVRIGSHVFAGLVEVKLSVHLMGSKVVGVGDKCPILILHVHKGEVTAIDIFGRLYQADEIRHLYPQVVAQLDDILNV